MTDELIRALDNLNTAMRTAYRLYKVSDYPPRDEQGRRQAALDGIQEILRWRPLNMFKAEHLEFLELVIAYWRELEVAAGAPEPDELQ